MIFKSLRGMRDLFPEDLQKLKFLEHAFEEVFNRFNFQEIRVPILEYSELFHRTVGESSDIVNKELYSFPTKKENQTISLRPEGTAGVIRAAIEKKIDNKQSKFWYLGPMFRYERPQKGRYRQFHQAGIEYLGYKEGHAELECFDLIIRLLDSINISDDYKIRLNHLGDAETKARYSLELINYLEKFKNELSNLELERLSKNPLRVLDSKDPNTLKILEEAPNYQKFLNKDSQLMVEKIIESIGDHSNIIVDARLVRGLDYYSGIVFEVVSDSLGAQDAFMGGGRYDQLCEDLGGKPLPALGFAIGLERLIELMPSPKKSSKKLFIVNMTSKTSYYPFKIANQLRTLDTEIILEHLEPDSSIKSQLRRADKEGGNVAIIIGDDEEKNQNVIWKDLRSDQQQESIDIAELIEKYRKL